MDPLLGRMNPGRTDPIPSMAKRQGSILSFFGNTNGPTQQKTTKSNEDLSNVQCLSNVQSLLFIMIIYELLLLVN